MAEFYPKIIGFYDSITDQKPERFLKLIKEYSKKHKIYTILDIGCGTGTLVRLLAKNNFRAIGLDNSEVMLKEARKKINDKKLKDAEFRNGNMVDFTLKNKVDIITCSDAINHILDKAELLKCFGNCYKNLNKKGAFIFNTQTEEYIKELEESLGYGGFKEGNAFIWQDYLIGNKHLLEFTIFEKQKNGLYKKQIEELIQAVYGRNEVIKLLKKAGFKKIRVLNEYLKKSTAKDIENIFIAEK
ncbi:MAG: class I SAM-dependent methyltransferase [archaeon]